jgi:hypothetical protein
VVGDGTRVVSGHCSEGKGWGEEKSKLHWKDRVRYRDKRTVLHGSQCRIGRGPANAAKKCVLRI